MTSDEVGIVNHQSLQLQLVEKVRSCKKKQLHTGCMSHAWIGAISKPCEVVIDFLTSAFQSF